jgi:hypothetical protein
MRVDAARLADLATFARVEAASRDVEPWADIIAAVALPREQRAWLMTLYNTFDDLHSAWSVMRRWPTPAAWAAAADRHEAARYNCTQERRNLRGGRVLQRFASYLTQLRDRPEETWMKSALTGASPGQNFAALTAQMRQVWGVGRQAAFEWAEFAGKVLGLPVDAADGQLWESSGPRRCLERIFCLADPAPAQLDDAANVCREYLRGEGIELSWVDFETVICDFNVGRDGRYYPGRHLAALREEIDTLPDPADRALLVAAWNSVVPEPWRAITAGIDPAKMAVYRDTGRIITCP